MQQNKTALELSNEMVDKLIKYFEDRAVDYVLSNISDEGCKTFIIDFKIYRFFHVIIAYKDDNFSSGIIMNKKYSISLDSSQTKYSTANFEVFFKELEEQLELRIPDKFLEYYNRVGWKDT